MGFDFSEILKYLFEILGCLFAGALMYLIPKIKKYLTTKLNKEEMAQLEELIKIFVGAAEQQFKNEDPSGEGRKAYVEKQLQEAGYVLTEQINSMIENAVLHLNSEGK